MDSQAKAAKQVTDLSGRQRMRTHAIRGPLTAAATCHFTNQQNQFASCLRKV